MQIKKSSLVIFLSILAILFVIGIIYFNKDTHNSTTESDTEFNDNIIADSNYIIRVGDKNIVVSLDKWKFVDNPNENNYSKNYSALNKKDGEKFEQMVTVFLNRMTDDRKTGKKITNTEYIEAFVVYPYSITVQIRVDKGDYWILSRQTFESKNDYPEQTNVSYANLLLNFEDMQNKIDNTRYILNNEF